METIESLSRNERVAHVMLAIGSEPGDATTGRLLATVGAVEAVELAAGADRPSPIDGPELEAWRSRVAAAAAQANAFLTGWSATEQAPTPAPRRNGPAR